MKSISIVIKLGINCSCVCDAQKDISPPMQYSDQGYTTLTPLLALGNITQVQKEDCSVTKIKQKNPTKKQNQTKTNKKKKLKRCD